MENHIAASVVIFIVMYLQYFIRADVNLMCDLYQTNDDYKNNTVYTVVSYSLPRQRFNKIRAKVPCPCFQNRLCIRKCCLPEYTFHLTSRKCVRGEENDEVPAPFYTDQPFMFVFGSTCRSVGTSLDGYKFLEKNGHLESDNEELSMLEYCYDFFDDQNKYMILRCEIQAAPKLYTICQIVSTCLLSFTFAIYFFVDELRNLPGKILLCYVLSIIVTDIGHTVLQIFLIIKGTVCIILAYSIQFSFLSSFFWLNSMCIDLWLTFRKHSSLERSPQISGHLKKFLMYSVYAWGCPLVVSCITALADSSLIPGNYVKPGFGVGSCWFNSHEAKFWYFYSFVSVILIINLYMFVVTTVRIIRKRKQSEIFRRNGNKRHIEHERQKYFLYLKLFLIMGINWIMEVLSYYAQDNADKWNIWFIADVGNLLQGVFIFVIFVCKRNVLVLLNRKIYPSKMFIRDTTPTRGGRTFSTTTVTSSVRDGVRGNAVNEATDRTTKIDSLELANALNCFDQTQDG